MKSLNQLTFCKCSEMFKWKLPALIPCRAVLLLMPSSKNCCFKKVVLLFLQLSFYCNWLRETNGITNDSKNYWKIIPLRGLGDIFNHKRSTYTQFLNIYNNTRRKLMLCKSLQNTYFAGNYYIGIRNSNLLLWIYEN